ncbi:putative cytosolic iron-sulfur protein assembly protein 1 [Dichotomopilus funicola]|uniref:Cytosolic iron-sulfur protein assembly protein 1 n=1 Tax=Dichotomopilus funicola TaxID=1934379 RepID=A0AAN6ZIJ5_9PEZI|nr:putative cytosolic iron-sulfur protein assembly protein 1 [Dichotomopilus funicola]
MAQPSQAVTRTPAQIPSTLSHSYGLSPVTALAFYGLSSQDDKDRILLLAGEDTWLKVYDVSPAAGPSRLVGKIKVFEAQAVHGIYVYEASSGSESGRGCPVLVWGGQSVAVLPAGDVLGLIEGVLSGEQREDVEAAEGKEVLSPVEYHAPDWIYDGILYHEQSQSQSEEDTQQLSGALVTAHNGILPFSFWYSGDPEQQQQPDRGQTLTFGPVTSPSRPILYSANLALLDPSTLLVAAGTVFGEIAVWKYFIPGLDGGNERGRERYEVLYVLTGHEGSIFGVSISPEMVLPVAGTGLDGERKEETVRLLATCSDDRTVRVWDITERESARESSFQAGLDGARETGFGGDDAGVGHVLDNAEIKGDGDDKGTSRCVAVAMGHVSRIWHVKFGRGPPRSGGQTVELYSFGEDCSRQRWELELELDGGSTELGEKEKKGAERMRGQLRPGAASTCHGGKNIWSATVLWREDNEPLAASGGADGKIVVSGRAGPRDTATMYEDLDLSLTLDDVLQSISGNSPGEGARKKTKESFQRYAFLSDSVLAATAAGRLFLATMGAPLVWEEVPVPEAIVADLRSYNVIKSPAKDTLVLGSATGRVYVYEHGAERGQVREVASLGTKISDILLLAPADYGHPQNQRQPWEVVLNMLGWDHAVFLHFNPSTSTASIDSDTIKLPRQYIMTSALLCRGTLLTGSRTGALTVYARGDTTAGHYDPQASRRDGKTKDAVTAIVPIPGVPEGGSLLFLTTCRDGKCRIYSLDVDSSTLHLLHEIAPPLNTLESAFFTRPLPQDSHNPPDNNQEKKHKSQLILHGFHGPHFLTYNDTTRTVLSRVPCGGAHRPFATVSRASDPGQTRFVFSQAGTLRVVSQGSVQESVVKTGGHGREIKAVAGSWVAESESKSGAGSVSRGRGEREEEKEVLVATAAEDTTIRIWKQDASSSSSSSELVPLAILQGHSAGIQALRFFSFPDSSSLSPRNPPSTNTRSRNTRNTPSYLLSSAGSEELFLWRLSRLGSDSYDPLAVMREAVWDDRSADCDLRVVDFDVAAWHDDDACGDDKNDKDIEGKTESPALLITMVLSDSSIRSYVYRPPVEDTTTKPTTSSASTTSTPSSNSTSTHQKKPPLFQRLAVGRYTGACPTQVRHLRVDSAGAGREIHALTAFTDGHVAVWRAGFGPRGAVGTERGTEQGETEKGEEEEEEAAKFHLALVVRLHQSSIKSLDLAVTRSTRAVAGGALRWVIATGGDDNALGLVELVFRPSSSSVVQRTEGEEKEESGSVKGGYAVVGRYRVRDAHAAGITGVSLTVVRAAPRLGYGSGGSGSDLGGEAETDPETETETGAETHLEITTASNDQRVKLWRVLQHANNNTGRGVQIQLLQNRYSAVADAGCLERIAPGKLMVGGVGVEVWNVEGDI